MPIQEVKAQGTALPAELLSSASEAGKRALKALKDQPPDGLLVVPAQLMQDLAKAVVELTAALQRGAPAQKGPEVTARS